MHDVLEFGSESFLRIPNVYFSSTGWERGKGWSPHVDVDHFPRIPDAGIRPTRGNSALNSPFNLPRSRFGRSHGGAIALEVRIVPSSGRRYDILLGRRFSAIFSVLVRSAGRSAGRLRETENGRRWKGVEKLNNLSQTAPRGLLQLI